MFAFVLGTFLFWLYWLALFPLLCITSFAFYGTDKWLAKKEKRRIPEATLHMIDAFGGWPGGFLGQRVFRHKTQKVSFRILFWASAAFHLFCCYVVYRSFYG